MICIITMVGYSILGVNRLSGGDYGGSNLKIGSKHRLIKAFMAIQVEG